MKIVKVKWHDAGAADTIQEAAAYIRSSVGYLVKKNKKGIWLTMEKDQLGQIHFIPAGMIKEVINHG